MVVFAILFILALSLYLLYYLSKLRLNYWKKRNVLHPTPVPILGNYADYILLKQSLGNVLQNICKQFPDAPYIGTLFGTEPTLVLQDPELIKLVMTKDFYYFNGREITNYTQKETITRNVFFSGGDQWKVVRQNLTPLFSSAKMKSMFYLLENCSHEFENLLEKEIKMSSQVDVRSLMAKYTISGIGSCAFGIDTHTLDGNSVGKDNIFQTIGEGIFEATNYRGFKNAARAIWPFLFYGLGFKSFPPKLHTVFFKIMKSIFESRGNKPSSRNDFVDLILSFNENKYITGDAIENMKTGETKQVSLVVDDELLVAQCIVFFAAGFETSATTLSFTLFELAKDQKAQKKVQEEIDQYLKRHNNKLTYECVKELVYLDACVHEVMRLYPVVGMLAREVMEDYTLPTGLVLEQGVRVHLPVYHLHHHPDHFPEPENFKPERFLPENKHKIKPYTYMPFGEGPRICIGSRFAKMQVMAGLVTVLKRYQVELSPGMPETVKLEPRTITTRPIQGLQLTCTERNNWETRIFNKGTS